MPIPTLPAEYTAPLALRKGVRRVEASIPGPICFLHAENQSVTYGQCLTSWQLRSENRLYCLVVFEASLTNSSSVGSHSWRRDSHLIMYSFWHMDDPLIQCSSISHIFSLSYMF